MRERGEEERKRGREREKENAYFVLFCNFKQTTENENMTEREHASGENERASVRA